MLRQYRFEILIIVLIHLGFLVIQLFSQNYLLDDSKEYINTADNLITEGILYCDDPEGDTDPAFYTKRTPGYPLFLLPVRLVTGSLVPVIILQMLLSIGAILIMLKIFKPGKNSRYLLIALVALFPAQFIYANLVMSEILFQFVVMAAVAVFFRYIQTKKIKVLWYYQLLIITGILIKPVLYLFVIVNILLFIYLYFRTRQRLVIISSLVPLIFVIIFGGINQHRTGYFHISSIQHINLVDYNLYFYMMNREGKEKAMEKREQIHEECNRHLNYRDQAICLSKSATDYFREDLKAYGLFHAKGMVRFFLDPGRFDLYHFFGIKSEPGRGFLYQLNNGGLRGAWDYFLAQPVLIILLLLLIAMVNLLRLVGFLFFLFNRQFNIEFRLFLLLLTGFLAFATGPLGASRFMLPVVLILTGGAVVQYGRWVDKYIHKIRISES
ncbi:MAG: hypothetical protein WD052_03495 [Bacteroidales bacterium]